MPKATKETLELEEKEIKKKAKTSKKDGTTASSTKKSASKKDEKKTPAKKATTSKKVSKTADSKISTTKKGASKKDEKKTPAKNAISSKKVSKTANSKISTTKKGASKKDEKKTTSKDSSKSIKNEIIEYYDLPYRYNKTVVKILAQTPKKLFVYWDISDADKKNFIKTYGNNFFEITKPVLIIKNTTMNYSFEIDINDYANSWYLNINDSDCKYSIELGRRPIQYNHDINTDYIYVSSSNNIEAPNDRILFDDNQGMVYFRNVKTNITTAKKLTSLSFISNMGRIYNIYDLYTKIYSDENLDDINNPSSSFFK